MTAPDNKTGELVGVAAHWLADNWQDAPQLHSRTLREKFGLSFADAVKALAEAKRLQEAAHE